LQRQKSVLNYKTKPVVLRLIIQLEQK